MKLAHIINPVKAEPGTELAIAQPVTFDTMKVAHDFAAGKVYVDLFAVAYPEDHSVVPSFITRLPDLQRSVLDVGQFSQPRKYPILMDVLRALYNANNADYLIYTNMDIALMPQFYLAVAEILKEGYDALLINRRGISKAYKTVDQVPLMYSDYGKPHPGFDCFIFKRSLLDKIILENICLGVSFSEVALTHNLIAFAEKLKLVDDLHLTFHIGTEVMPPLQQEYYMHNRREYETKIYPRLKPHLKIEKFPYAQLPFHQRMLRWVLNPSFRTQQVVEMEGKSLLRRIKYRIDEIRFGVFDK